MVTLLPQQLQQHEVSFNNCAAFTKCISKIDGTTKNGAEDLYLVMPMYNLIEYSSNYSKITGRLSFYSKDEANNFNAEIANNHDLKSFKYKTKLLENTVAQPAPNQPKGIFKKFNHRCAIKILK